MAGDTLLGGLVLAACLGLALACAPPQPTATPVPAATPAPTATRVPPAPTPSPSTATARDEFSKRSGFLRELGVSVFMQGTHKLVDDRGELICLLSGRESGIDLNKAMDQGKVNVYGTLAPTVEGNAQIMEVRIIEPIE